MQSPGYIGAPRERGWYVGLPIYFVKFHQSTTQWSGTFMIGGVHGKILHVGLGTGR
jgi:hypothetical protein